MTDDELQERLRRLGTRPDADWDAMAAAVRDGYARATAQSTPAQATPAHASARAIKLRRRRWAASAGGALALAAALILWLHGHGHRRALPPADAPETFHVFEDLEPGEMLEELTPEQIDRMAKAFNKGA